MKKAAKKKSNGAGNGVGPALQGSFRSFAKLAEQAADVRAQLRGLRVAHDPRADRFVAVHLGTRVEFILRIDAERLPPQAAVQCRRMNSAGGTEKALFAGFRFNDTGIVLASSIPERVNEKIDLAAGAWSIAAAVMWNALLSPA